MLVLTLCYRIIGFVREMLVASYLGTSAEADAYSIAYSVPTVVVEMLALGAIGSASIAVFQSVLQKDGKQRLNQLYRRVMAAILLALAALPTAVSLLCTTQAIHYIGPTPTAILGALEPVTAVFFGVVIFHEELTARLGLGIALILVAVTLIVAGGRFASFLLRFRRLFPKRHRKTEA